MRIEVIVPDNSPEGSILASLADPQAYVLKLVRIDLGASAEKSPVATPDYRAIFSAADSSKNRFKTRAEIDAYIDGLRNEW